MIKNLLTITTLMTLNASAQELLTPEKLWEIKRISPLGTSKSGEIVLIKNSLKFRLLTKNLLKFQKMK